MPTIGQKLEETRLGLGLTVEDVAHKTRIHPSMILSIEEDDLSRFPSVAYAKSFIRKYGDHLGIDLTEAMETLGGGTSLPGDKDWMAEAAQTARKEHRFRWERFGRRTARRPGAAGRMPLFLNFILVVLMAALGIFYFLGYNAPTPEKAREEIVRGLGLPIPLAETPEPEVAEVESHPMKSAEEAPAVAAQPPLEDLPALSKAASEAQAAPLPKIPDPAATERQPETAPPAGSGDRPPAPNQPSGPPPAPQPALRAVPVAVSE